LVIILIVFGELNTVPTAPMKRSRLTAAPVSEIRSSHRISKLSLAERTTLVTATVMVRRRRMDTPITLAEAAGMAGIPCLAETTRALNR